jgi:hypothetical protein
LILLPPSVQFKSVESNALATDTHLREIRAYVRVEEIAVHAEIAGRIPETQDTRHN